MCSLASNLIPGPDYSGLYSRSLNRVFPLIFFNSGGTLFQSLSRPSIQSGDLERLYRLSHDLIGAAGA